MSVLLNCAAVCSNVYVKLDDIVTIAFLSTESLKKLIFQPGSLKNTES